MKTLLASLIATTMLAATNVQAEKYRVYFGTYTRAGGSQGIYTAVFDPATGKVSDPVVAAETTNPSFVAFHPSGKYLYAVGELPAVAGKKGGAVSAFALDAASGKLTLLNQQSSQGPGPCHVAVDPTGKVAVVANYSGGSTASFPIGSDGRLGEAASFHQHEGHGPNKKRQQGPHAHSATFSPDGRFVYVADLGTDKLMIYRVDTASGKIEPNDPPAADIIPGAGPRHMAFHPNGRLAYVINELGCTITPLRFDAKTGVLEALTSVPTIGADYREPNTTAEVQVHPNGRFVYGSNRGQDTIAIFAADAASGALTYVASESTQGKTPRNFTIDPTGQYLLAANQDGGNVVAFRIDGQTGKLTPTGQTLSIPMPVCIKFLKLAD